MIKVINITPPKRYGNYFLSVEAPEDEASQIKSNTRVIEVKPNNRNRLDFTDGAEEPVDEPADDNQQETEDQLPEQSEDNEELDNTDDNADYTADDASSDDTQSTDDSNSDADNTDVNSDDDNVDYTSNDPVVQQVNDTNEDIANDQQNNDEASTDDTVDDEGNTDTPDIGGDEQDFTDDTSTADSSGEQETTSDNGDTQQDGQQERGPGLEYDSTRKYNLYKEFMSLATVVDNYISKLESLISDDAEENKLIKVSTDKMREVRDITYDFMTMKFEASSYVQSLLFYQSMITTIQMIFDMLEKARKKMKINHK